MAACWSSLLGGGEPDGVGEEVGWKAGVASGTGSSATGRDNGEAS